MVVSPVHLKPSQPSSMTSQPSRTRKTIIARAASGSSSFRGGIHGEMNFTAQTILQMLGVAAVNNDILELIDPAVSDSIQS